MENPFRFGGTLGLADVVNRQAEIAQVVQTIKDGEKLFLIGPRRFGKTTVLNAARQVCEHEGAIILYFNAEAYTSVADLTNGIFESATQRLIKPSVKAKRSLREVLSRVKPTIQVNLLEQTISGSLTIEEENPAKQVPLLVNVLNIIEELAAQRAQPVGLILDEFQRVIELGGAGAEGQIRAAIQEHRKVGYVFAGSKTRMLAEMTSDHARPFYRLGSRRFLDQIPRADLLPWLARQFAKSQIAASAEALNLLISTIEEVPYDVQKLAKTCWTLLLVKNLKELTPEIIHEACETLLEEDGELYAYAWNQLTPYQQIALIEVRREGGVGLTSRLVLKRSKLNASTMRKCLAALLEKGLLRTEEKPNETRWRYEDPLFAMWVERLRQKR